MKKIIFITVLSLLLNNMDSKACSCGGNWRGFYEGINPTQMAALIRIDSIKVADRYNTFTYITILDDYKNEFKEEHYVFGTGHTCNLAFDNFMSGDTLVLTNIYSDSRNAFWVNAACNIPFLLIKNGHHEGSTLSEIKQKIIGILTIAENKTYLEDFKFFPNPCIHKLTIEGLQEGSSNYKIQIFNAFGILTKEEFLKNEIDMLTLPIGIYFVKILNSEDEVISQEKIAKL